MLNPPQACGSSGGICSVQEARLQQLSMDLRSELSSGSLSQLKGMISDFMQQLKDSVSRQGQIQPDTAVSLGSPEPLPQMGNLAAGASSSSTQAVLPGPQARQHHVSQKTRRGAVQEESALLQGAAQSQQQTAAQSVTTEDEIELDLPESPASSVIEEEAGPASRAAESVAESVSDFQYSMDFEGSMHRSPMSGFRSPVPGQPFYVCPCMLPETDQSLCCLLIPAFILLFESLVSDTHLKCITVRSRLMVSLTLHNLANHVTNSVPALSLVYPILCPSCRHCTAWEVRCPHSRC